MTYLEIQIKANQNVTHPKKSSLGLILYSASDNNYMKVEIEPPTNRQIIDQPPPQNPEEIAQQSPQLSFLSLFRFADSTDKALIFTGSIASLIMGASFPIFAFIAGDVIDQFSQTDDLSEATENLIKNIILGVIALVMGFVMFSSWTISGERQAVKCRKQYFKSILNQQLAWFDLQEQASISTQFQLDCLAYQLALGQKLSTMAMVLSMLIVGIAVSLYTGWILTLVTLAYLPFIICAWTKNFKTKVETGEEEDNIYRQSDRKAQESIGAIKLVKQMNAEQFQHKIQFNILEKIKEVYNATITKYIIFSSLAVLSLDLTFPIVFSYGSQCVFDTVLCPRSLNHKQYTAGSVVVILYALLLPAISLNQLAPCIEKIAEGKSAAKRIFAIIDREPLVRSKEGALVPPSFRGELEFRDVSFAYPKSRERKVLSSMSLRVDCRHSAIVGPSGGGKSTIFQLIMRFYDPDEGSIILDGTDLRDLDLRWLRAQLGYVTQEPTLFAASIRENLLLGKPGASEEELEAALAKAEALQFVSGLRDGLETHVGSGGSQLSGGQKQRVAIARALVKGPRVLLMDEATSALDRTNEREILSTLMQLSRDFISISITHRNRVLAGCDKVFLFQNGKITSIKTSNNVHEKNILSLQDSLQLRQKQQLANKDLDHLNQINQEEAQKPIYHTEKTSSSQQQSSQSQTQQENPNPNATLSRLCPYFLKQKTFFFLGIFFSIADGLVFPSMGILVAKIIAAQIYYLNSVEPEENRRLVRVYYLLGFGLAVIGSITNTLSLFFFGRLAKQSVQQIRMEVYRKVIDMPIGWFQHQDHHPEKITSDITVNCKYLFSFQKLFMPHVFIIISNVLFSLIGAVIFEWRTGLTAFGLIPLIILSQYIQLGFVQGLAASKGKIYNSSSQIIKESVMNIRTVLSLDGPQVMVNKYQSNIQEIIEKITGKILISGVIYGISAFLQYVTFALIFFLAAVYVNKYDLSINGPLESIFLIVFAGITAGNNSNFLPDISNARIAARQLFGILDLEDQYQARINSGSKLLKQPVRGNIQFNNVCFKYQSRQTMALDNFDLDIKEGQNIGIVGSSGCGKSTLFNILQGFYSPLNGTVLLDGHDIIDFDLHHLRSSFGVVSQEPTLFNQSIEWNIRYNLDHVSEQDILKAADAASFNPSQQRFEQLSEESSQPAQQINEHHSESRMTPFKRNVGPKGSHVSGGQKQRIAVARAILRRPSILLLDEATSALDPQNESKVQQSLKRIMRGKTTVNITHRLQKVQELDKIVVVHHGEVIQEGTYTQLSRDAEGSFYRMLNGMHIQ